ncbi:MAG: hypothetical protein RIA62_17425 [Cyclobacteriaceae bacterium]|tara:strand:- start:5233 stop:5550 length:318 start_codon:yes stop_codon:yes gene_type:complete
MNKLETKHKYSDYFKLVFLVMVLSVYMPAPVHSQDSNTNLESVNEALSDEAENIIETGRIVANIVVVIAFVLLMMNIAFKVMDNSRATAVFIFIIVLRGLYEVIF